MASASPVSGAQLEIGPPRLFSTRAVLTIYAYGLLLVLPFLVSVFAVSMLRLGPWTAMIPMLCVVLSATYLPFAFGNARVARLVRALNPSAGRRPDSFIVQVTLRPRIRSGLRAALEDADDVGCLSLNPAALEFQGDSVKLRVPYDLLGTIRLTSIGLRGLWVYGPRLNIGVSGLPNVAALEFTERESWLLPTSWRTTRELRRRLSARTGGI